MARPPDKDEGAERHERGEGEQAGIHVVEVDVAHALHDGKIVRIQDPCDHRMEAAEEDAQHDAGQQHQPHVETGPQHRQDESARQDHQGSDFDGEFQASVEPRIGEAAENEDEQDLGK